MTSNDAGSGQANSQTTNSGVPVWFWIVGVIALLWNLMGMMAFFADPIVNPGMMEMASSAFGDDKQETVKELYESRPTWVLAAFAVAVFGGVLGCVALLMRKKIATYIFLLSLVGVVLQNTWNFFMANMLEVAGMSVVILPALIFLVGAGLVFYSLKMTARGWLT